MLQNELIFWSLTTGVLSALATGLGAGVALFVRQGSARGRCFANAFAAGMMTAASVYTLIHEAVSMGSDPQASLLKVVVGILLGALFFSWMSEKLDHDEEAEADALLQLDRRSLLVFLALFVHSIPEGVAIGVGFATGDVGFGLLMAAVIAIHNVPEGIAMTLPMRAQGASMARCAVTATLTSLPQPLLAVPAALLFAQLQPALPVGLGFACGAMLYIVLSELLPEALAHGEPDTTAWGATLGVCAMLAMGGMLG